MDENKRIYLDWTDAKTKKTFRGMMLFRFMVIGIRLPDGNWTSLFVNPPFPEVGQAAEGVPLTPRQIMALEPSFKHIGATYCYNPTFEPE